MEFTAIECKVELAWRIEEHHFIVGIQKQVYVFSRISRRPESWSVGNSIPVSELISFTVGSKVASVAAANHWAATESIITVTPSVKIKVAAPSL